MGEEEDKVQKRFFNQMKGDNICETLPHCSRWCRGYGTYCMRAEPWTEYYSRVNDEQYYGVQPDRNFTKKTDEEIFVIQIFEHIDGMDFLKVLDMDNSKKTSR